jgi:hypothetical protein
MQKPDEKDVSAFPLIRAALLSFASVHHLRPSARRISPPRLTTQDGRSHLLSLHLSPTLYFVDLLPIRWRVQEHRRRPPFGYTSYAEGGGIGGYAEGSRG